jgi:environmental stress-induced protein Ves
MRVIRALDRAPVPWANGGGMTRDLASAARGATVAVAPGAPPGPAFDWRLSLADIDRDGRFSSLPGVDRVFAPVEGAVALAFDGIVRRFDDADAPLVFDGAAAPDARLHGAGRCRALNLMLARGRCAGTMRRVTLADGGVPLEDAAPGDALRACFVQRGDVAIAGAAATRIGSAGDLLLLDPGDPPLRALGPAVLLAIVVRRTPAPCADPARRAAEPTEPNEPTR